MVSLGYSRDKYIEFTSYSSYLLRASIRRKGVIGVAVIGIDIHSYLVISLLVEYLILCIIGVSIVVLTVVIGARDYS